jgi:glucose-6-phosphate 1-dehydrogenase
MVIKNPGAEFTLAADVARLPLGEVADTAPLPAYVKLIRDSLTGDRALFTRPDGLAHTWEVIAPILANPPAIQPYDRGSWGPAAAIELAGGDGWLVGDTEHVEGRSTLSILSAHVGNEST